MPTNAGFLQFNLKCFLVYKLHMLSVEFLLGTQKGRGFEKNKNANKLSFYEQAKFL